MERCKNKDLLESLLAEMSGEFPQLSHIFVNERDQYMAHTLHAIMQKYTAEVCFFFLTRCNLISTIFRRLVLGPMSRMKLHISLSILSQLLGSDT